MHTQQCVYKVCTVSVCAVWAVLAECVVGTECTAGMQIVSMCVESAQYVAQYSVQLPIQHSTMKIREFAVTVILHLSLIVNPSLTSIADLYLVVIQPENVQCLVFSQRWNVNNVVVRQI